METTAEADVATAVDVDGLFDSIWGYLKEEGWSFSKFKGTSMYVAPDGDRANIKMNVNLFQAKPLALVRALELANTSTTQHAAALWDALWVRLEKAKLVSSFAPLQHCTYYRISVVNTLDSLIPNTTLFEEKRSAVLACLRGIHPIVFDSKPPSRPRNVLAALRPQEIVSDRQPIPASVTSTRNEKIATPVENESQSCHGLNRIAKDYAISAAMQATGHLLENLPFRSNQDSIGSGIIGTASATQSSANQHIFVDNESTARPKIALLSRHSEKNVTYLETCQDTSGVIETVHAALTCSLNDTEPEAEPEVPQSVALLPSQPQPTDCWTPMSTAKHSSDAIEPLVSTTSAPTQPKKLRKTSPTTHREVLTRAWGSDPVATAQFEDVFQELTKAGWTRCSNKIGDIYCKPGVNPFTGIAGETIFCSSAEVKMHLVATGEWARYEAIVLKKIPKHEEGSQDLWMQLKACRWTRKRVACGGYEYFAPNDSTDNGSLVDDAANGEPLESAQPTNSERKPLRCDKIGGALTPAPALVHAVEENGDGIPDILATSKAEPQPTRDTAPVVSHTLEARTPPVSHAGHPLEHQALFENVAHPATQEIYSEVGAPHVHPQLTTPATTLHLPHNASENNPKPMALHFNHPVESNVPVAASPKIAAHLPETPVHMGKRSNISTSNLTHAASPYRPISSAVPGGSSTSPGSNRPVMQVKSPAGDSDCPRTPPSPGKLNGMANLHEKFVCPYPTSQDVDGVLEVDAPIAQEPLESTGSCEVPQMKEAFSNDDSMSNESTLMMSTSEPSFHSRCADACSMANQRATVLKALSPNYPLETLTHRRDQWQVAMEFVKSCFPSSTSRAFGSVCVSGPRGTGKSAMVSLMEKALVSLWPNRTRPLRVVHQDAEAALSSGRNVFADVATAITKLQHAHDVNAIDALDRIFRDTSHFQPVTLLVLDKVDVLFNGCGIFDRFMEWAHQPHSTLIVVAISNTIELTRAYLRRQQWNSVSIVCSPYDKLALGGILSHRLNQHHHEMPLIDGAAIEYVAEQVAAISGDAQMAMDICVVAILMQEQHDANVPVSLSAMTMATSACLTHFRDQLMHALPSTTQMVLYMLMRLVDVSGLGSSKRAFEAYCDRQHALSWEEWAAEMHILEVNGVVAMNGDTYKLRVTLENVAHVAGPRTKSTA
ncbi:hypothetical protein, variant [Aphanomyces invadans]|uniref:AAA+ ATPase domain-containing protein n=1 Tax=Aphanomyces invadans TaxID=157072 RepID=A0A024U8H4_9STRA|nr:hypothetical protein H310_06003 [Aphanomyces invadans]XP_008869110.1 hypothetical protein, variant [Aphanomyces invadans]ETW02504.1 hypothetical protein H310_06003 [Aphanomyces invadans]ETW02505.1 hypothetical protein, variant [Aphanomyces invadans]|eukprot:XP_008869109.1 hypothetical protein H310_06003 [Aphanomyces invadans]